MSFSPLSLAFSIAPRLPLRLVMRMADAGAIIAARRGGAMIDRLRSNMARLTGTEPSADELRDAVRSHIRNYAEQPGGQFKLGSFYKQIAVAYGVGLRLKECVRAHGVAGLGVGQ